MKIYWELAICVGSIMGILVFSGAAAQGRLSKNSPTIKFIKIGLSIMALISLILMVFELLFK